jgi:3-deoxy-7-phosphoheptulonate synthase
VDGADDTDLVNARITGLSVVVTPAAVATVVPLPAASTATTRAARRAVGDIVRGADDRLTVIAGPCSIHDPAAAVEYAGFIAGMRERHGADLEVLMRTYTEKPRTEVDWKGFAYDPFLDGSSRISVGLVATRMLMRAITALGVPVAAEPLNALTPQYVNGLVTYNGVGARNVTDQTARERASGFSSVIGFKNSPEGSIGAAISAVLTARAAHEFLGVDGHGVTAQLSTTGNDTAHVILRGDKDGPNHSAAHVATTKQALAARGLPEVVVVDASHGNSQKDHRRQAAVVADLAGQIAGGERALRGVMIESNLVEGRQDLDRAHPGSLEYGKSVTDACVDLPTTERLLAELAAAVRARREV